LKTAPAGIGEALSSPAATLNKPLIFPLVWLLRGASFSRFGSKEIVLNQYCQSLPAADISKSALSERFNSNLPANLPP